MSQINCPHFGFVNFAISAYCGRCERPPRDPAGHAATPLGTVDPTPAPPASPPLTPSGGTPIRSMPPPARSAATLPPSARPTAPLSPPPTPPPRPGGPL